MSLHSQIESLLTEHFSPEVLSVENESHQHAVPPNSETHFKVVMVAEAFEGKRRVGRHQAVYGALDEPLKQGVHALTLHLYTPDEWQSRESGAPDSPPCMGGSQAG
ncbi:BolA family transcriptional regulator [Halovibrio salipaludis]|uniref:BolA family transcriptional regulator n=1 Tax=Halovibrio salipaludis TaxID=2032626 RepID=A0A2A2F5H9_9GAMM|nr:BolA family protein [Halovibrio salipaludis]PAU80178.1 BolA family transcriptional regulator [Halovibrio salipaludis]